MPRKNPAAVLLGTKGGKARTEAKAEAARLNGAKGGRPEGPLTKSNIRAAKAVCDWLKPQSGDELFRNMGSLDWLVELGFVIQRAHRLR